MHFLTRNILPTQLWEERKHHKIYNQSVDVFDRANIKVDIFYHNTGRRPSKGDLVQVNTLVTSLRNSRAILQQKVELASDTSTRTRIGERDYGFVVNCEKKLGEWLGKVVRIQEKLQKQVDAETWNQQEEDSKSSQRTGSSAEFLIDKPLPPLCKSVNQFRKQPVVNVVQEKKIEV